MRETPHRICRLADEAAATTDPETALLKLRELRAELEDYERSRVAEALRDGSSFGAVAKALGISRQAAHRRYRDVGPAATEPMPLSSHARRALYLAREEAAAAGARRVASEHLLLGVLRSGGSATSALEAGGVTADAARRCVRSAADGADGALEANGRGHGDASEDAPAGERGSADGANAGAGRTVLAEAVEIARARHARYVDAEHIALAALNGQDGGALRAITALGVRPGAVRARLGC